MSYETLTFDVVDNVAVITLNRPESLNALNDQLKADIAAAVKEANDASNDARAILITGSGRGFCSGADLTQGLRDPEQDLMDTYLPFVEAIVDSKIPVVTAVNGIAAGAGMSLALLGDIVVAGESAAFLQAFVNIGLVPDAGSSYLLPRLIGRARANEVMMLGEKLPAATALDWGMINRLVKDEDLMDEAMKIASKFANGPTVALNGIRKLSHDTQNNTFLDQFKLEAAIQGTCAKTDDCFEGVSAFIQKRKADFKGK